MKLPAPTYNVWVGGSCDYSHKDRPGAAAAIIERTDKSYQANPFLPKTHKKKSQKQLNGCIQRYSITDFHTTEFRMMLTLIIKVMEELPEMSDITLLTNVAYIKHFDRPPTENSANQDLIRQCIYIKQKHKSVNVKIVHYHKSPLLVETHQMAGNAMKQLRTNRLR